MKKLVLYMGIIVGLFVVLFLVNQASLAGKDDNVYGIPAKDLHPLTVKQLNDPNYQNIILPGELEEKLANKEDVFVYFFSPDCPHCKATTPHLMPLAEELGVDVKQYNVLEFEDAWSTYNLSGTPTLVYFQDGVEVDRIVGGMLIEKNKPSDDSVEMFRSFFQKYAN